MGVQMNLPPRYVQLCQPDGKKLPSRQRKGGRQVTFEEHANQTFHIERLPKHVIWYTESDYVSFSSNWKYQKRETMIPRKKKKSLLVGRRKVPHMEEYQTFAPEGLVGRRLLVQSILMHQATCRAKGYIDPDGCSYLSKALSKAARKQAWQSAAVNEYEVECFRRQDQPKPSLVSLFSEYYIDSIHPQISSPIQFLSKLLMCEFA